MSLPPPPPPHPGSGATKEYAKIRERTLVARVAKEVRALAKPRIADIQKLLTWRAKQDAVDELFESIELQLKTEQEVLGRHPHFEKWVEESLERYLESVQESKDDDDKETEEEDLPIFMDLYSKDEKEDAVVPKILHPLAPHTRVGSGRVVEEWELSAHKGTRRIMLRDSTRQIAKALTENESCRVYVCGERGVGKVGSSPGEGCSCLSLFFVFALHEYVFLCSSFQTAALASIVASARKSGSIVLYLPDGDRLRKLGYYIEPNANIKGLYDLPILSQEVCSAFLKSHQQDLEGVDTTEEIRSRFMTENQIQKLNDDGDLSLIGFLRLAQDELDLAASCYSIVVHTLMTSSSKPFIMVVDEFNCYYDHGHYFHGDYDGEVENAIPCNQISLFQPFLDGMGLQQPTESNTPSVQKVTKGGIVVGITKSRAVANRFTQNLSTLAHKAASSSQKDDACPLTVVEVPRYSTLEVDHIVANLEITGIGRLRFDRGDTVMNEQEVAYLRMVSGAVGQNLLDACIV